MDKIRDRGNIKWSAMMLTEHREMLRQWGESQDDVECSQSTEEERADFSQKISRSAREGIAIWIKYYHTKRYHRVMGVVRQFDPISQTIHVESQEDNRCVNIPIRDIASVELDDEF